MARHALGPYGWASSSLYNSHELEPAWHQHISIVIAGSVKSGHVRADGAAETINAIGC